MVSKTVSLVGFLFICLFFLYPGCAQSQPRTQRGAPESRKDIRSKDYRYIRAHDLNNDGRVDSLDKLIWSRDKDSKYTKTYISKEDEDIADVMDLDGDGDVAEWEISDFYIKYDKNGNGILEDEELEAAVK